MLGERLIRTERPKKRISRFGFVISSPDIRFDGFIANDDAVFLGIPLQLYDNLRGMYDVYDKKTKEQADDEGKSQILGKPVERVENMRVYEKIIKRAEPRPYERKFRTDNTLDIAPFLGIVPQSDLGDLQARDTGNIFDHGHAKRHHGKKCDPVPNRIPDQGKFLQARNQVQQTEPAAVQGQIRSCAEAGTNPPAFRIGRRKKPPEQKLYDPSRHRADKE